MDVLRVAIFFKIIYLVIFWGVGTVEMTVHFTICKIVDAKFIQNPDDKLFLPNVELEARCV